jgi:hypothetical protein
MTSENNIDALLREAKDQPAPMPSSDLISRVLADAASLMPEPIIGKRPKRSLWARLLAPIGGIGGAATLAACATFGVFAGAGYADEMLAIPGLNSVLAGLTDTTDSTTPFESLSLLMSEG